jgi:hypothetical protein
MPIFILKPGQIIEVGPSTDGKKTFLSVRGTGIWIPPDFARKVAASLVEYADRQDAGVLHPVAGRRNS